MTDEPEPFNAMAWIAEQRWTFARTAPEAHEYVARTRDPDPDFMAMARLIGRKGRRGTHDGIRYRYLTVGPWVLWVGPWPCINRRRREP